MPKDTQSVVFTLGIYAYSQISINLKLTTSNNPLSVIVKSGIIGSDKNDKVKNGLKSILGDIILSKSNKSMQFKQILY